MTALQNFLSLLLYFIVNSTDFTVKISFLEICFVKKSHHNTLILRGATLNCSTFFKIHSWTNQKQNDLHSSTNGCLLSLCKQSSLCSTQLELTLSNYPCSLCVFKLLSIIVFQFIFKTTKPKCCNFSFIIILIHDHKTLI